MMTMTMMLQNTKNRNLSKMHPQEPIQTGKLSAKASLGRIAKRFFKNRRNHLITPLKIREKATFHQFQFVCDQA